MNQMKKIALSINNLLLHFVYSILSQIVLIIRSKRLIHFKIVVGLLLLSSKSLYSQEKITLDNNENQVDSLNLDFEMESSAEIMCYEVGPPNNKTYKAPEIKGGQKIFNKFVFENLEYPQEAIDNKIQGFVTVKITVNENGEISNPTIIKGLGYGCDEEALRLVKIIPKFNPGKQNGENSIMDSTISFRFTLPLN